MSVDMLAYSLETFENDFPTFEGLGEYMHTIYPRRKNRLRHHKFALKLQLLGLIQCPRVYLRTHIRKQRLQFLWRREINYKPTCKRCFSGFAAMFAQKILTFQQAIILKSLMNYITWIPSIKQWQAATGIDYNFQKAHPISGCHSITLCTVDW